MGLQETIKFMDIRPYNPADRHACLTIFDLTECRSPATREEFERFLEHPSGPYFVMEHDGSIIGCGGYTSGAAPGVASLVWGMIRDDVRGQGLGRFLLMYRLREIAREPTIERVVVEVPAGMAGFFEHQGFKPTVRREDRVELVKRLAVCT